MNNKCVVIMRNGKDLVVSNFNTHPGMYDDMDQLDFEDLLHFHFSEKVDFEDPERFGLLINENFFPDADEGLQILRVLQVNDFP